MCSLPPTASLDFWQEEITPLRSTSAQANTASSSVVYKTLSWQSINAIGCGGTVKTAAPFVSCHCPMEICYERPPNSKLHECTRLEWPPLKGGPLRVPLHLLLQCRRAIFLTCFLLQKWKLFLNTEYQQEFDMHRNLNFFDSSHLLHQPLTLWMLLQFLQF